MEEINFIKQRLTENTFFVINERLLNYRINSFLFKKTYQMLWKPAKQFLTFILFLIRTN